MGTKNKTYKDLYQPATDRSGCVDKAYGGKAPVHLNIKGKPHKGLPTGGPAPCHPDKPVFEKGLCRSCYWHKIEKPNYQKAMPVDFPLLGKILGLNKDQTRALFYNIWKIIKGALQRGESVRIRNFGTFYPRTYRLTGVTVGQGKPSRVTTGIGFKPVKALRWLVNHPNFDPYAPPEDQDDRSFADLIEAGEIKDPF